MAFTRLILLNRHIEALLNRLPELGIGAWLASGCLVQTVWNLKLGRRTDAGIRDYDVIYCDPDTSWEAEDAAIRRADRLFADLPIRVEVRNQSRVPLWYRAKFGFPYPPVREPQHAVLRYPSRTTAVAVTRQGDRLALYAPFGLRDALTLRVRPNHRLPLAPTYAAKTERWRHEWPALDIQPWSPIGG